MKADTHSARAALEHAIEHAIALLDFIDPDPDLEPSLSGGYGNGTHAYDAEGDDSDLELSGDENEPSLGSLDRRNDQQGWAGGSGDDREQEHDGREPDEADYEPSGGMSPSEDDFPCFAGQPWRGPAFAVLGQERCAARRSAARLGRLVKRVERREARP